MFTNCKYGAGHALIVIGLGAGLVSMGLNVYHSLHIALWSVPIIILSESARIVLPFVAATRGWTGHLKATFGAVVVLCLLTSTAFLADSFAKVLLSRGHQESVQAQKTAKIGELKIAIAEITEKLSSKTLNEMVAKEEGRKDKPGCGKSCLEYKERAGKAERREALEDELKALTVETQTAAPVEASGLGLLIGSVTGLDKETGSAISMILLAGAILYCLDLLVYLIIPGAQYCRQDAKNAKIAAFGGELEVRITKVKADGSKKVTKDEAYQFVISHLLEKPEGSILTSRRQLAALAGVPKTTFCSWMQEWVETGKLLAVTKTKHRELISLPKAA
jgi:hypothetical protein